MLNRRDRTATELHSALVDWATDRGWKGITRTRVPISAVRTVFHSVHCRVERDEDATILLRECLIALHEQERITPLKETDREKTPLPVAIWLKPTVATTTRVTPPMPRWHPEISDLADDWPTATPKQRARYLAINQWLMSGPDLTLVPLRERALEIFGTFGLETDFPVPEKALDRLDSGPLFGDTDRLHEVLCAFPIPPPLLTKRLLEEVGTGYYQRVGAGNLLLVVENTATWWSIVRALPRHHNVGHVAWGLGMSFTSSIQSIADNHEIAEVRYFGDLDLTGIRIPHSASRTARDNDLPPVRPAVNLYTDLLTIGRSSPSKERALSTNRADYLVDWLEPPHQQPAIRLLTEGRRIAQEWVGLRHLSQTTGWYGDLT